MSYPKPRTGNPMNDYFTALNDFTMLAPKLLAAKSPDAFEIWLDKLMSIDRRSLVLYIKEHEDEMPPEHVARAKARLAKYL